MILRIRFENLLLFVPADAILVVLVNYPLTHLLTESQRNHMM